MKESHGRQAPASHWKKKSPICPPTLRPNSTSSLEALALEAEIQHEDLDYEAHFFLFESGNTQRNQDGTAECVADSSVGTFAMAAIAQIGCRRVVVRPGWLVVTFSEGGYTGIARVVAEVCFDCKVE